MSGPGESLEQALLRAAAQGDLASLKEILGQEPSWVNYCTAGRSGTSPMHTAIFNARLEIVEELLSWDADLTLRCGEWQVPPVIYASLHQPAFLPYLLEARDELTIFEAAAVGDALQVDALLRRQPSMACLKDASEIDALFYAVASRVPLGMPASQPQFLEIARLLLRAGADPDYAPKIMHWQRHPPLYWAAQAGQAAMVKLLLEQGAQNLFRCTDAKGSLLHAAAENNWTVEVTEVLLQTSLRLKGRDRRGNTPHDIAVARRRVALSRLFEKYGSKREAEAPAA